MVRGSLQGLLIHLNGPVDVARLIEHVAEKQRGRGHRWIELERIDEKAPGVFLAPLQVGGDAGAEQQRRLLRGNFQRFIEGRRRVPEPS
jgi:hypothetical protein